MLSYGLLGGERETLSYFLAGGKEMAYGAKAYTLRKKSTESGTRYFISFKDGQGGDITNWKCPNNSFLNFVIWKGGTETLSNGTSGTGSLTEYGMKRFTDVR